jgi:lipid-binding SYLF domain-containing protein
MMENPFGGDNGPTMSIRQDAQRRAAAMASPCNSDLESSGFVSYQSAMPVSPSHPLLVEESTIRFASPDMAQQARKDWKNHGESLTQALENKRLPTESHLMIGNALSVRVLKAEKRVDLSGAKYTSYVIKVHFASPSYPSTENNNVNHVSSTLVEHRYSEFAKLDALAKKHDIVLDKSASFPGKSWAGRVGNWTPSLTWAPEKHDELISYRVIQLDCWLVHVVRMYNQGALPLELAQAVYEFLVAPSKPPCENTNDVDKSSLHWYNPVSFTLGSGIRQATRTVHYMCCDPYKLNQSDQSIPLDLLHAAKGLCFLTVVKAGLVVSGRIGTGVLVARMDDPFNNSQNNQSRWSAPCAIGTVGMGWGALAGADITHFLVVLTTTKAVEDFCGGSSVQLGAEMGVAVGPVGRGLNSHLATGDWTLHPAYAYAHSQGLFVGMSLEGSVVSVRNDVNAKFYGRQVSAKALLSTPGPKAAEPLYKALDGAMQEEIPDEGFRPSTLWNKNSRSEAYQNHPHQPVYLNQHQSPVPPPIMQVHGCFENTAVNTPSQYAGSGSMESYQSTVIPGGHVYTRHPEYQAIRSQTIETMNPGPQPLFDPTSPNSTDGGDCQRW